MTVKQISVFMENTPGRMAHFTRLMGNNNLNIVSLTVADGPHLSILRCIVAEYEKAVELLSQNGYNARLTDVLAVKVPDQPGELAKVSELLCDSGINVEYIYSFVRGLENQALFIVRVDKMEEAVEALGKAGVELASEAELSGL